MLSGIRVCLSCRLAKCVYYTLVLSCTLFVFLVTYTLSKGSKTFHNISTSDLNLQIKQSFMSLDIATTTIFPDKDKIGIYTRENIKTFTKLLLTNGDICSEKLIDIIIYIQSHWINVERRRSLRETWIGTKSIPDIIIKSVFILGKPSNSADQIKINNENLIHRDIVQGDFIESFQNLTLKSIIALEWIYTHCRQAEFVLKADDDIFVDIFKVVNMLLPQLKNKSRNIVCSVRGDNTSPIVRDKGSKWYIPEHIFPKRTHLPRFCTGYFVVMTSDLVPELSHASVGARYIPVDDVYLFGLLAQTLSNVTYTDITTNMTIYDNVALDDFSKGKDSYLIAGAAGKGDYMAKMWMEVLLARHKEKH